MGGRKNDIEQSLGRFGRDGAVIRSQCFARLCRATPSGVLLIAVTGLALAPAQIQSLPPTPQGTVGKHVPSDDPPVFNTNIDNNAVRTDDVHLSPRQKRLIMRARFEMSKNDAAELAALAKGLREELDKPNVNVLSPQVMNRAEKIEKLAKKIREETKGF